ncbi:MAG: diguanylate cyclase domain-containing protein [Mariprofundus sp.]
MACTEILNPSAFPQGVGMGKGNSGPQPALIIGAGRGGLAFMEWFANEELFRLVGVADNNPNAQAFELARELNVPIFHNAEDALDACKPCTVFNLTHNEGISDLAADAVGASSVIGGLEARLIWEMVTQLKEAHDKVKKLAHYDFVTKLPNRILFFDHLDKSISHAKRYQQKLAVLFLDLDGFKSVNDTLGHLAGDSLLGQVADRIRKTVREEDTVARFGGDEFTLFLNDVKGRDNVALVASKILTVLAEPFLINGEKCQIGGSIGISIFPDDHLVMETLTRQADAAMYTVKQAGKNGYRFYEKSMDSG